MTTDDDFGLAEGQGLAARDAYHRLNQIDARNHFGDRMLDLDAGVHLDEEELARGFVVKIFERARAPIR